MTALANKTILITGANRGIGKAFVEDLIKTDVKKIYAAARDVSTLTGLVTQGEGKVIPVELDVTNDQQVLQLAKEHTDIDVLINNAGIAAFKSFLGADDLSAARNEMEVNYFAPLAMVRAFAPVLADKPESFVINLASIVSFVNIPSLASYCASKAATHSLTQGLRAELQAQNTKVIGVYPGPIVTDMAKEIPGDKTAPQDLVHAVLDGIGKGLEDIYPDPVSKQMHAGLLADPKAVEKQASEM